MHAGMPTPLAVTVLADFPVRVTAEVTYGNNKVAQTEDFQGGNSAVIWRFRVNLHNYFLLFRGLTFHSVFQGVTRLLTLPPVSMSSLFFVSSSFEIWGIFSLLTRK